MSLIRFEGQPSGCPFYYAADSSPPARFMCRPGFDPRRLTTDPTPQDALPYILITAQILTEVIVKYVESTLLPGERIVCEGHPCFWAMGPRITLSLLLMVWGVLIGTIGTSPLAAVGFFAAGLGLFGASLLAWWTTEFAVTNKRVVAKFGAVRRHTVELTLAKIESVRVEQSLIGRIFDYGSLVVGGGGLIATPIPGISNPHEFRRMVFLAHAAEEPVPLRLVA
ncbi:PH domain-containing protein [Paraburkholderia sp. CNPSo 3274]|uniref:PH domain-containing protein n=1 Tax=Paraburkholderia sp. CNPSo 3274 TaxID=2940932 RepID=UPI0020B7C9BA|nr:PH domain-containing protein [Paraburkholderia sp. CNPSo 3274]MCP3713381.1 PH domain-containing protein [Paraburkholderia sp. CNPSo 3274]